MTKDDRPPTFDELLEAWEAWLKESEPYEADCARRAKVLEEWHQRLAERVLEIEKEPEQCSQCGAVVEGHHACQGVPGGFGEDEES